MNSVQLYSKGNLVIGDVASVDKNDRALNCVHFAEDGSTVASNGRVLVAVGPVDAERLHFPEVDSEDVEIPGGGASVGLDIVDVAVRNLPKDKRPSLQCCRMTVCREEKVEFTAVSARKEQRVGGRPIGEGFPEWKGILKRSKEKAVVGGVCVSRRDLMKALAALDEACGSSSSGADDESPVFVSFGGEADAIVLRSVHLQTGQRGIGIVVPLQSVDGSLRMDEWERGVFGVQTKVLRRKG